MLKVFLPGVDEINFPGPSHDFPLHVSTGGPGDDPGEKDTPSVHPNDAFQYVIFSGGRLSGTYTWGILSSFHSRET